MNTCSISKARAYLQRHLPDEKLPLVVAVMSIDPLAPVAPLLLLSQASPSRACSSHLLAAGSLVLAWHDSEQQLWVCKQGCGSRITPCSTHQQQACGCTCQAPHHTACPSHQQHRV